MAESEPLVDKLLVAIHKETGFVHVQGRGSFKISTALKQFGQAAIEAHCVRLVMDMEDCIGMDSTFMGVLAGLAFHLRKLPDGAIIMVNLNPRTRGLLGTLGLDQIIEAHLAGAAPETLNEVMSISSQMHTLETDEPSQRATAETMLEAHENLIQLSPDNLPKFKDVLTFLRQDIQRIKRPGREGQ
ncbi:MAG: STAS domain-containing protein [Lentisphaerota bacterium]